MSHAVMYPTFSGGVNGESMCLSGGRRLAPRLIGLVISALALIGGTCEAGPARQAGRVPSFMAHQAWGYVRLLGPPRLDVLKAKARFQAVLKQQPNNAVAKFYLDIISRSGPGWRAIEAKLDTITLNKVEFAAPGVPLRKVLAWLTKLTKARDPDHQGINFFLAPSNKSSWSASHQTRLEPTLIQLDPGFRDITVQEALRVIAAIADCPKIHVQFTVADCGIICSRTRKVRPDQFELVTQPGTRLILSWSVYTNGVLDATASRTRTYAPTATATTNVVLSLSFAHGSVLGVPGGPIAIKMPVNAVPVNDVASNWGDVVENGWIPASRRRVTLFELTWNNGGDAGMNAYFFSTIRGGVVVEAEAEPLSRARGRQTAPMERR